MKNFCNIMAIVCSGACVVFLALGSVDHATLAAVMSVAFKIDAVGREV